MANSEKLELATDATVVSMHVISCHFMSFKVHFRSVGMHVISCHFMSYNVHVLIFWIIWGLYIVKKSWYDMNRVIPVRQWYRKPWDRQFDSRGRLFLSELFVFGLVLII